MDNSNTSSTLLSEMRSNEKITNALLEMGATVNLKGFGYLVSAISLIQEDFETYGYNITKILYPTVAKLHKTTSSRVERNIRQVIDKIFCEVSSEEMREKFGRSFFKPYKARPTNSEFMCYMAYNVK